MQLSTKLKTFCKYFVTFLEFALNFEHFQKKYEPHCLSFSKIIDSERRG